MTLTQVLKKLIKGYLSEIWWHIYGRSFKNPAVPSNPSSLLFVCKGNICRSPFAERMAQKLSRENGLGDLVISSAGLEVFTPEKPPVEAIMAAQIFGIDLGNHIAQGIEFFNASQYDMIVAMEVRQLRWLRAQYPNLRDRLFLLPLYENDEQQRTGYTAFNITDPYGANVQGFANCYARLASTLNAMLCSIHAQRRNDIGL